MIARMKYTLPATGCLEKPVYHKWATDGAIHAYKNQGADYEKEATEYASDKHIEGSVQYFQVRKAFMSGVKRANELDAVPIGKL